MNFVKRLLFPAFLAPFLGGAPLRAAEFEVLDRFSVDGYTVLKGSADIPGGSFTVGGSTLVVKNGNVGIGTASPGTALHVNGTVTAAAFSGSLTGAVSGSVSVNNEVSSWNDGSIRARLGSTGNEGDLSLYRAGGVNKNIYLSAYYDSYFNGPGNIGIGTTAPLNPLHVAADASTDNGQLLLSGAVNTLKRLRLGYNTTGNYGVVQALTFGSNYDPLTLNPAGGNVGIGTTAPGYKLHVAGDIGVNSGNVFRARYSSADDTYSSTLGWYGLQLGNNGDNHIVAGRTNAGGALKFIVNNTSDFPTVNGITAMTILSSGKVGIGTINPTAALEVNGGVRINTTDAQPACDATKRGTLWFKQAAGKEYVKARIYAASTQASIYNIQYSDDGSSWSNAATAFGPFATGWNEKTWSSAGAHRYWRFYLTNTPGGGPWLNEFEMYLSGNINSDPTSDMLAQSGMSGYNAAACVDDNTGTNGWHTDSATPGAWLKMTLPLVDYFEVCGMDQNGVYLWRSI